MKEKISDQITRGLNDSPYFEGFCDCIVKYVDLTPFQKLLNNTDKLVQNIIKEKSFSADFLFDILKVLSEIDVELQKYSNDKTNKERVADYFDFTRLHELLQVIYRILLRQNKHMLLHHNDNINQISTRFDFLPDGVFVSSENTPKLSILIDEYKRICLNYNKTLDSISTIALNVVEDLIIIVKKYLDEWMYGNKIYLMIRESTRNYCAFDELDMLDKIETQTRNLCCYWKPELMEEHWLKMKNAEDTALSYAIMGKLVTAEDECLKGYGEEFRKSLESNPEMVKLLMKSFSEKDLFFFNGSWIDDFELLYSLNYSNFDVFKTLVLRGDIIRCNLYPELKPKFEAWIKGENTPEKAVEKGGEKEKKASGAKCELSDDDKSVLEEIKKILKKGKWNTPANPDNIIEFIETLYGARLDKLDDDSIVSSAEFRKFFRTGKSSKSFSRLEISTANVVGYLMECGYLDNAPLRLSRDFFCKEGNENNINKGKSGYRSGTFEKLVPFMDKYRQRIIEKHD